jgi:isocitrate dehydrogenase
MAASYNGIPLPADGSVVEFKNGKFAIPDNPIIPFIEGDGTGRDIWKASVRVVDAAVEHAYLGKRRIAWYEVFAGEKAKDLFDTWLPEDTLHAFHDLRIGIKGPLTTPIGGGIRSLNVALRQKLDLYACVRPVKYYRGIPSPVKHPDYMNMVIFRENTEDVYQGIEWREGTPEAKKLIDIINNVMLANSAKKKIREDSGIGIKPISITGTKRLVRMAIDYALKHHLPSVTLVHKGNIMKYTEGAFREWGYEVATQEFRSEVITERESWIIGNVDNNPSLSIEDNAHLIEPGMEHAPEDFRQGIYAEVRGVLESIYETHGRGKW